MAAADLLLEGFHLAGAAGKLSLQITYLVGIDILIFLYLSLLLPIKIPLVTPFAFLDILLQQLRRMFFKLGLLLAQCLGEMLFQRSDFAFVLD